MHLLPCWPISHDIHSQDDRISGRRVGVMSGISVRGSKGLEAAVEAAVMAPIGFLFKCSVYIGYSSGLG